MSDFLPDFTIYNTIQETIFDQSVSHSPLLSFPLPAPHGRHYSVRKKTIRHKRNVLKVYHQSYHQKRTVFLQKKKVGLGKKFCKTNCGPMLTLLYRLATLTEIPLVAV